LKRQTTCPHQNDVLSIIRFVDNDTPKTALARVSDEEKQALF
jgi:hypothetical protein